MESESRRLPFQPDDWFTALGASQMLGRNYTTVRQVAESYRESNPEWFQEFRSSLNQDGRVREFFSPELIQVLSAELGSMDLIPDGWLLATSVSALVDKDFSVVRRVAQQYRESNPEWFRKLTTRETGSKKSEYFSPDLINLLKAEIRPNAPEGWLTVGAIEKILKKDWRMVNKAVEAHRQTHPEDFGIYSSKGYHNSLHISPALAEIVIAELQRELPEPEEGWMTRNQLVEVLPVTRPTISKALDKYRSSNPEWYKQCQSPKDPSHQSEYFAPELIAIVTNELSRGELAPEGWQTVSSLHKTIGASEAYIRKTAESFRDEHPEWFSTLIESKLGHKAEHLAPELAEIIICSFNEYKDLPEGWMTVAQLAEEIGVTTGSIYAVTKKYKESNPEWFRTYLAKSEAKKNVSPAEHLHPELIGIIRERYEAKKSSQLAESERQDLELGLTQLVSEIAEGETVEAKKILDQLSVYPELVSDILLLHHPEYQGLGLPYLKRVIGEYLGDILLLKGDLQLDKLEKSIQFLSDAKFREKLTEVIKNDCLNYYNHQRREGLINNDRATLEEYFADLRSKTANFDNSEWLEVLNDVEEYYRALFEAIQIPDHVLEELDPERLFPDINQRINILELMGKKKMLFADKPGVGKSASAILAKESLGAKQALVVAPSNVIDVWQQYLSDYKNGDGSAKGYFKEGQAPRVLTIDNGLSSLEDLDMSEFDYVLISQERLDKDGYVSFLEQLDYDMLIVDEIHKLKNIQSGKRADSLVKLAEKIEGDDKYLALLSGTPVPNKVGDIAMILKLLYPEKFEGVANKELTSQILRGDILDLRSLLVPRMQMKSLAETVDMPELIEEFHAVEMSEAERKLYEVILEHDDLTASQKLQILRQLVLNPDMFDLVPDIESSKHAAVGDSLRSTFTTKDKVVMFVNGYVDGVIRGKKSIFGALNLPDDVEVHTIHGKVSDKRRLEIQKLLQEETGKKILLAVSGQTADVGVDFSGAQEVYFYNEPWSEYDRQQQLGRVFRPGLKGDLACHTFYVEGTIEEGIHRYIEHKFHAVEKLLRGIPISEIEQEMLRQAERQNTPNLEVNSGLAESYLSTSAKMLKIFNYVNEIGQEGFVKFGERLWTDYAKYYSEIGSRSYQANAARLSGTVIERMAKANAQSPEFVRILDVASGPEMLKRHMPEEYQEQVVSVDINPHHFEKVDEKRRVGSFLNLPIADSTMDYVNFSLALHYTERPRKDQYERIRVFQELNRVLVNGGTAVINLAHNHGLKNTELFTEAAKHLGFQIIEDLSGEVSSGNNFRSQMLVLQKVSTCTQDTSQLVKSMGPVLLQGFKFTKTGTKLRDSRKITTRFFLSNGKNLDARLNEVDQAVFDEEQAVLSLMDKLKKTYKSTKSIPGDVILQNGLSRAKTDKKRDSYILFKSLETGNGAIITR